MPAEAKTKPVPAPNATPKPSAARVEPKPVRVFDHDRELVFARFSPCGKFLLAGSYDGGVYRWDLAGGAKTALKAHRGWLQGLAFHPDAKAMFTGDSWGTLCRWDYAGADPVPRWTRDDAHPRWMRSLALSPDGSLLATCGADRVVRLWSADDGSPRGETPAQGDDLLCAAFHPGGALAVGDLKGVVTHWEIRRDASAPKPVRRLDARTLYLRPTVNGVSEINDVGGVRGLSFDPAGKTLACAGSQPASSGFFTGKPTVVLLDWETGARRQLLQWENADPSEGIVMDAAWHPGGYLLAVSSGQPGKGAFYGWKPGEAAPFYLDKKLPHCRSVSLHPDGARLAVAQVLLKPGQGGGNGRKVAKDGDYFGLVSQVRVMENPASHPG